MTIVKKHDSIQGGREGGIQLSRASATLLFLCLSARHFKSRFSAGQFDFDLN